MLRASFIYLALLLSAGLLLGGCVLTPRGTHHERQRLSAAGEAYQQAIDTRTLPELGDQPTWRQVLHRAFLANGDLEAAYFEWQARLARINQAAAWPNSNVALGFDYMFSSGQMKSWDRTTVSAGFDPAMSLSFPTKVARAGKVALDEARQAGYQFAARKFDLQQRVLTAYLELALAQQKIDIQRDNVALLQLLTDTVAGRVRAGAPQQDLLKVQTQYRLAENELRSTESEARSMRAMLNGMLRRDPTAELSIPELPAPRAVSADDARLIAVAVDQNPELTALAQQVKGRGDALELARMAYIPDINPTAGFTGSVSQSLGAMVMLPTALPRIRGMIDEARAMLRSSQAMQIQARNDRAARFVSALYAMRNAERQVALFEHELLPLAEQTLNSSRQGYTTGAVGFIDLIDSQRTLLDVRLMIAEVRVEREKRLAEMEALAGTDVETLAAPATAPATIAPASHSSATIHETVR